MRRTFKIEIQYDNRRSPNLTVMALEKAIADLIESNGFRVIAGGDGPARIEQATQAPGELRGGAA